MSLVILWNHTLQNVNDFKKANFILYFKYRLQVSTQLSVSLISSFFHAKNKNKIICFIIIQTLSLEIQMLYHW